MYILSNNATFISADQLKKSVNRPFSGRESKLLNNYHLLKSKRGFDLDLVLELAELYRVGQFYGDAEKYYLEALAIDNDYIKAIVGYAQLLKSMNKIDKAIELFDKAVHLGEFNVLPTLIELLKSKNEFDLVVKYYLLGIERKRFTYADLAAFYEANYSFDLAEKYYLLSISESEDDIAEKLKLVKFYKNIENYTQFLKYLVEIVEVDSEQDYRFLRDHYSHDILHDILAILASIDQRYAKYVDKFKSADVW
jgi:tetratricopeptide (TPR) repeat protein